MEFKGRSCGKDIGIFIHEKGQKGLHCYSSTQLLHYKSILRSTPAEISRDPTFTAVWYTLIVKLPE